MPTTLTSVRHKSIRLRDYDYTTEGVYFITICAANRATIFGEVSDAGVRLTQIGQLIEDAWYDLPNHHHSASLDLHVVMPNHFHGLIVLSEMRQSSPRESGSHDLARRGRAATREAFGKPVAGSIPTIVRSFKAAATRRVNQVFGCGRGGIWQRNYYEHIIRNENTLHRAREYIQTNPLRWSLDPENPSVAH
jgi:REP element-mobilizing transposase RayT